MNLSILKKRGNRRQAKVLACASSPGLLFAKAVTASLSPLENRGTEHSQYKAMKEVLLL